MNLAALALAISVAVSAAALWLLERRRRRAGERRERSLQAIVGAYDEALGKALRGVVEWTIRELAKAEAAPDASAE